MKELQPFRVLVDVFSRRVLLFSGAGRKDTVVYAKLEQLATKLRELAPGNTFIVNKYVEAVVLQTPMERDAMTTIFRAAAEACDCPLV